ncbi:hypothetical protein HR45_05045 [Shewanella mangrovi]|uniref:Uncharacterized protein n=1 Tax=Shewanella mangrovi TaxID=1515746 RepID=A0A094K279_9GAMM|nr:hypothetical protein [Shewanella mangrovi]KFZ38781.1 hypothetical protein HR45_05045 [Shewanella mangrovi]
MKTLITAALFVTALTASAGAFAVADNMPANRSATTVDCPRNQAMQNMRHDPQAMQQWREKMHNDPQARQQWHQKMHARFAEGHRGMHHGKFHRGQQCPQGRHYGKMGRHMGAGMGWNSAAQR